MTKDTIKIGKFTVSDTLGVGGMGIVYAANDPDIGRKVAIKVLHSTGNPLELERFKNEARTIGELAHPNIVVLLEYGIDNSKPFLVMEYLPGQSLEQWIGQSHKLGEHKDLLIDLCRALKYAHEKNILHRDLKPGNVQVLPGGQAKLLDFGIAQSRETGLTLSGVVMGTPKYLAPEVLQDEIHSKTSDCYSLGLIAYTMLSGSNPFSAGTLHAAMVQQLTLVPPPLHKLNQNIPKKLSNVIEQYLDKDPDNRPSTPDLLEQTLKEIVTESEVNRSIVPVHNDSGLQDALKTVAISVDTGKSTSSGQNKLLLALGVGVAAIVISFTAYYFTSFKTSENTQATQAEAVQQETEVIAKQEPDVNSLNQGLRFEGYSEIAEKNEVSVQTNKNEEVGGIGVDGIAVMQGMDDDPRVAVNPVGSKKSLPDDSIGASSAVKNEKVVENVPEVVSVPIPVAPEKKKPVKSYTRPVKISPKPIAEVKTPVKKMHVPATAPPKPIILLPSLNMTSARVVIKSQTDIEISKGKTRKIIIIIPDGANINEFKIFRGSNEIRQVEIRHIKKISSNKIQLSLYADTNAILGAYTIYGIVDGKKTTPVRMKVTL